jgi:hypothetical protein
MDLANQLARAIQEAVVSHQAIMEKETAAGRVEP